MTIALATIAPAAFDGRPTSNADFQTVECMIERHGLAAILSEMVTIASMQGEADRAQGRRSRSFDKRANLNLRAMLLAQAADAMARAEALAGDAAAVMMDAPVE